jgi:unsaturated rhamnogalacturonyl hydrolase
MGWYVMALVDVLDYLPESHPKRGEILRILRDLAAALLRVRDADTALWYQVVDQGSREGNYLEASASAMLAYAYAKGARKGYLDASYRVRADETFEGIARHLVTVDDRGFIDLHQVCRSAGLGGKPYRDGSYAYYISEPKRLNDMKGYGPLLRAAIELERGRNAGPDGSPQKTGGGRK